MGEMGYWHSDWAGRPKTADPLGLFIHVYKWYHWYMEEQETGFMEGVFFLFLFFFAAIASQRCYVSPGPTF